MSQIPRRSAPRRRRSEHGRNRRAALAPFAGLLAFLASSSGCGGLDPVRLAPNQPPTVTLTSGPVDTLTDSLSWIVDIAWSANDPDGRVDRFEYAVDPPSLKQASLAQAETSWVVTTADHATVRFRASRSPSSSNPTWTTRPSASRGWPWWAAGCCPRPGSSGPAR